VGVAVGDLFGDGNKELVAAAWDQQLYAWNKDGGLLSGFPIHTPGGITKQLAIS